jgi:hypothetical protein
MVELRKAILQHWKMNCQNKRDFEPDASAHTVDCNSTLDVQGLSYICLPGNLNRRLIWYSKVSALWRICDLMCFY